MEALKSTANKLLFWSLALPTIATVAEQIGWLSTVLANNFRAISLGLFGLAIILYVFWGAAKARGSTEYTFTIQRMKPGQMDISISLSRKLFPAIPTKRELKNIYKVNNSVCKLQSRQIAFLGFSISKYTGLCSIAPMTNEARDLLERENLNGLSMTSEHLEKTNASRSCLYIGAVGAIGSRARKHISVFLSGLIDNEFEKGTEVIYTRPTTKDGLRIAKKFGFSPVMDDATPNELGRVYRITRDEYESRPS